MAAAPGSAYAPPSNAYRPRNAEGGATNTVAMMMRGEVRFSPHLTITIRMILRYMYITYYYIVMNLIQFNRYDILIKLHTCSSVMMDVETFQVAIPEGPPRERTEPWEVKPVGAALDEREIRKMEKEAKKLAEQREKEAKEKHQQALRDLVQDEKETKKRSDTSILFI